MELDQIFKLIDAGFTKADIEAFGKPAAVKPEEPAVTVSEPAPVAEPAPAIEPVKAQTLEDPTVKALLDEVKSLRKQLQLHAIVNDGFQPADQDDAQKILASIINPVNEKKGK